MKATNDRTKPRPAGSPALRQRFRIQKLEERIAPKKGIGGVGASKNCPPSMGGSRCDF